MKVAPASLFIREGSGPEVYQLALVSGQGWYWFRLKVKESLLKGVPPELLLDISCHWGPCFEVKSLAIMYAEETPGAIIGQRYEEVCPPKKRVIELLEHRRKKEKERKSTEGAQELAPPR